MSSIPSRHAARLAARAVHRPPVLGPTAPQRYFSLDVSSWWKGESGAAAAGGSEGVQAGASEHRPAAPLPASPTLASPGPASPASPSSPPPPASTYTTINAAEIAHFSRLSAQWWDEHGEFGLLHKMNPVRMEFVRQKVEQGRMDDRGWKRGRGGGAGEEGPGAQDGRWLEGMDVLDVGCGGGLLAESLARVGGRTLAIDASPANIAIASLHAAADPFLPYESDDPAVAPPSRAAPPRTGSLRYRHTSAEELEREGRQFDLVCSMEVVEHVDEPAEFIKSLGRMVRPGGHLILSTISRTALSRLLTITLAESVLRLVTPGTHTHAKYIRPAELLAFVRDAMGGARVWTADGDGLVDGGREGGGVGVGEVRGIVYDPLRSAWRLWPEGVPGGDQCNYLFHVRKRREGGQGGGDGGHVAVQ